MFSDYNGIRLEINNRMTGKIPNPWKLNNTLLNNPWVKEEVSGKLEKYFELNEYQNITYQNL